MAEVRSNADPQPQAAIPMFRPPTQFEDTEADQSWASSQSLPRRPLSYTTANYDAPMANTSLQYPSWDLSMHLNGTFECSAASATEPLLMTDLTSQAFAMNNLSHSTLEDMHSFDAKPQHGDLHVPPWILPAPALYHRANPFFQGSEADTDLSSQSPSSIFSEYSYSDQPSYRSFADQPSTNSTWVGNDTSTFQTLERSRSRNTQMSAMGAFPSYRHTSQATSTEDLMGHAYSDEGLSVPSMNARSIVGHWPASAARETVSEATPGFSQWVPGGLPLLPPASVYSFDATKPTHSLMNGSDYSPAMYTSSATDVTNQDPEESADTFVNFAAQTAGEGLGVSDTQRKEDDEILLEGKRCGLTYKEIKKRMRTRVAESTLRGRYRSLTKPRLDRVRKPKWTDRDVYLLKDIVASEMDRLDDACYRHSTREQKLSKLSWKRVAKHIASNGGSYHFGNSTCKKKWMELDSGC